MGNTQSNEKNVHEHHRRRMKEHFLKDGLDTFNDIQALEMLLFYSIPRYDTNEIAHALLDEFGSFSAVFDADIAALKAVPGIGNESAIMIKFISQMYRRYGIDHAKAQERIPGCVSAQKYLVPYFMCENDELFVIVLVDAVFNIRKTCIIDRGNEESVFVNTNRVIKEVINNHCSGVILAHSHPNGFSFPSKADREVTMLIAEKLRNIGVKLCDHLIVSRNDVYFMSQESKNITNGLFVFSDLDYVNN